MLLPGRQWAWHTAAGGSRLSPAAAQPLPSSPVPDSHDLTPEQHQAAAVLLRKPAAEVAGLARLFARRGHELALVGGTVRDVFLGRPHSALDLATDATPAATTSIAAGW